MSEKILQARTKNQKHCNKTALEDYNREHYNNQDINLVSKNYITTTKTLTWFQTKKSELKRHYLKILKQLAAFVARFQTKKSKRNQEQRKKKQYFFKFSSEKCFLSCNFTDKILQPIRVTIIGSFQKTAFYNGECHCSRQQPK